MTKKPTFLVTGGAGFIGSEVMRQLVKNGYFVRVADNLSKPESKEFISKKVDFRKVDLTNYQDTLEVFKGIDICVKK